MSKTAELITIDPKLSGDRIDRLIDEWCQELIELDASALGIIGRIQFLGSQYETAANKALKPLGLKFTDFDVLGTLRRKGHPFKLTPTEICNTVLITSGAMTAALDRLENTGLIVREAHSEDRRIRLAALTEEGVKIAERAAHLRFSVATTSLNELTQQEQRTLEALLRKLVISNKK